MFSVISRSTTKSPYSRLASGISKVAPIFVHRSDQVEYLNSVVENPTLDWTSIKAHIISQQGSINQKNFEGIVLKVLVNREKLDAALSFVNHLRSSSEEMTLGSINGILALYYSIWKTRKLSNEEKFFIMDSYKRLYDKYKVLDFATCEKLVRALCAVDEWEKALWVLEDIHLSSVPSHSAFSVLVGTLFRNNKKKKAFEVISESLKHKRPLQYEAFEEWINFILRKYKDRNTILKHLSEIHEHISKNYVVVDIDTANKLKETYCNLGWVADFTEIRRINGECMKCKEKLHHLKLTDEEFSTLQQNVKEKLIVGSDLFLKSSPEELKRFSNFLEKAGPFDIVIDALNVAFALGRSSQSEKIDFLIKTVNYFKDKKILLLGRKHMTRWDRGTLERHIKSASTFFTDDVSQDDPFFITAAILSGPHTDIVSKDLLRGHQFNLQDENLKYIFKKWQWQHQWMVFIGYNRGIKIQAPLKFTPCAQKNSNNGAYHLPYQQEDSKTMGQVNDGIPDLNSWLCIRRKDKINKLK